MKTIFLCGLLAISSAFGADAISSFAARDYTGAAQQIDQKLATSPPSAEDYYNLALAREKAGNVPLAVLNYERALLLDPGLRVARNALATLAAAKSIPLPPRTWIDDVNAVVHPDVLVVAGSLLFWAGAFGLLLASRSPATPRGGDGPVGPGGHRRHCLPDRRLAGGWASRFGATRGRQYRRGGRGADRPRGQFDSGGDSSLGHARGGGFTARGMDLHRHQRRRTRLGAHRAAHPSNSG